MLSCRKRNKERPENKEEEDNDTGYCHFDCPACSDVDSEYLAFLDVTSYRYHHREKPEISGISSVPKGK